MTSKLVVNTIEADTGISSVSFASSISLSSTSVFHLGDAGFNIGADTNINRPSAGVIGFNINGSEAARINANGFSGDGSQLTGLPAGLGTALSTVQTSPLNKLYYTDRILSIGSTVTVDHPASATGAYTQYADILVEDNADLIVADGDDLIPDILGLGGNGTTGAGGAGRLLVDNIVNRSGTGAPTLPNGAVVTGVCTATSFSGSGSGLTGVGLYSGYALMEEAIEHGATAHTKTSGNWYTKQLSRISFDPQNIIVSLSSNEFTLAAGTYVIKWVHLLERCDEGITRLYDVTNSTSKKVSLVGFAQDSGNYAMVISRGITRVTITGNTTYKYQYFVNSANSVIVGPASGNNSEEEIFGQVEVWKET